MLLSSALRRLLLSATLALAALAPSHADAQTNPVEPYYAVTTRADVPLKSGDMDGYYPVATLKADQVLRVDAEGAGWARVAYPPGLTVYVRADEVREDDTGKTVVLTKVSALKSKNAAAGFAQSWQRAIPRNDEPKIGTRLTVVQPIKGPDGTTIGYEVEPPPSVRGYIKADSLRLATDSEVQSYLATLPKAAPEEKPQETPAEKPQTKPETKPEAQPETKPPSKPGEENNLLEPMVKPGEEAAQPAAEQPEQPAEVAEDDGAVHIDQQASPESRLIGTLQHLSELFNKVQRQDSDTAELDELAAEFRRAIAAQGDDPIGRRIRDGLSQRLQLVETRIEARNIRRDLRAKREAIEASYAAVGNRVQQLERTRGYQFVGRLVRSSVYDGARLPLMYRMVSVNESVPRTIGYIVPDQATDYASKLGQIVGVLGASKLDPALNLRIVTPTRVDVLAPEGLGLPAQTPEPAEDLADEPGS